MKVQIISHGIFLLYGVPPFIQNSLCENSEIEQILALLNLIMYQLIKFDLNVYLYFYALV